MFKLTYTVNGKKVSPAIAAKAVTEPLEDALDAELQKNKDSIKKKVGEFHCPEHKKSAKLIEERRNNYSISGCCDELIERVIKELKLKII